MFSLIQLPNLRWIPKALSSSPTPQRPSPTTQLPRNTIQENVRYFILISPYCPSYQIITNRKRSNNRHPQRVFEISSQNCYLVVTSPTIEHHTITISTIYAFKNASSKNTPSTKYHPFLTSSWLSLLFFLFIYTHNFFVPVALFFGGGDSSNCIEVLV